MTTSNHVYAGAVIALAVEQPYIALPLALLSHFVLDALPHYGYGGGGYTQAFKHRLTWVLESVNVVLVPLLAYLLLGEAWWVWLAAVLAISPDFMWVYRYFWFERKGLVPPGGALTRLHHKVQWCERRWGILVEIPLLVFLIWLVVLHTTG